MYINFMMDATWIQVRGHDLKVLQLIHLVEKKAGAILSKSRLRQYSYEYWASDFQILDGAVVL
jgi:hypothetical protein